MAGGYTVGIASDTKAFKQGIETGIIDPLEDAQKELVELGKSKGPEQLEKGMKDAEKATDRLKDETKRTADAIEQEYRDSYRKARQSADDGLDGMKRNTEEVTSELKQNLGETFSSFRGDLEDLPQIAQDTLGGLAGSGALGGIGGVAATAAGAAGLGMIIGAMDTINERAEALEDRANDMATAFIEAGSNVLNATTVAAAAADVITDPEKRKEVQAYADALGVDFPTAVRAYVGDANALAVVDGVVSDARRENVKLADEQREALKALTPEQQNMLETNSKAIDAGRELNGVVSDANAKYQEQQGVLLGLIGDAGTAGESIDELGNKLYTLPDGTEIMISAETGQATTDVAKFKGDTNGVIDQLNSRDVVMNVVTDQAFASIDSVKRALNGLTATINVDANVRRVYSAIDQVKNVLD